MCWLVSSDGAYETNHEPKPFQSLCECVRLRLVRLEVKPRLSHDSHVVTVCVALGARLQYDYHHRIDYKE